MESRPDFTKIEHYSASALEALANKYVKAEFTLTPRPAPVTARWILYNYSEALTVTPECLTTVIRQDAEGILGTNVYVEATDEFMTYWSVYVIVMLPEQVTNWLTTVDGVVYQMGKPILELTPDEEFQVRVYPYQRIYYKGRDVSVSGQFKVFPSVMFNGRGRLLQETETDKVASGWGWVTPVKIRCISKAVSTCIYLLENVATPLYRIRDTISKWPCSPVVGNIALAIGIFDEKLYPNTHVIAMLIGHSQPITRLVDNPPGLRWGLGLE